MNSMEGEEEGKEVVRTTKEQNSNRIRRHLETVWRERRRRRS